MSEYVINSDVVGNALISSVAHVHLDCPSDAVLPDGTGMYNINLGVNGRDDVPLGAPRAHEPAKGVKQLGRTAGGGREKIDRAVIGWRRAGHATDFNVLGPELETGVGFRGRDDDGTAGSECAGDG